MAVEQLEVQAEVPVNITHPDKILFPEVHRTKIQYLQYLATVAPVMLPYLADRSITLVRCPHGAVGKRFYQRHVLAGTPEFVPFRINAEGKKEIVIHNIATLLHYGNLGALEFHAGLHRLSVHEPDTLSFDLDPTDTSDFERVREVAIHLRDTLQSLQLPSLVKTSGATGLQVYVPLQSTIPYDDSKRFVQFIARYLEQKWPNIVTTERFVKDRGDKVYVDAPQHGESRTLICAYSVRATPSATVSTPITWSELENGCHPRDFTIDNVPDRIRKFGDLFHSEKRGSIRDLLEAISGQ
ncbi:non-homologous end-joining DNA ligase [Alicyclobacillus acidiphilus]|uniref:non-homologous end-joining DNA ligase n=1 Tax=Alicyclobacillus acidiphilus TaxID=182455 RepID=UPI0008313175|nr:non-homologous end-joining DNA ligase [Alicyclobacillus acidiphilus]